MPRRWSRGWRRCSTSPSPTPPRCPPRWCASWPGARLRWRCPAMAAMNCSSVMAATGARGEGSRTGGAAALLAEMGARGIGDVYRNRVSRWREPAAVVIGAREPDTVYRQADPLGMPGREAEAMMLADFLAYLPDDLLC